MDAKSQQIHKSSEKILKQDRALFADLSIIICQSRHVLDFLGEFFKHKNQPYLPSLRNNGEL